MANEKGASNNVISLHELKATYQIGSEMLNVCKEKHYLVKYPRVANRETGWWLNGGSCVRVADVDDKHNWTIHKGKEDLFERIVNECKSELF
ncbi:MAG: hypothetical protein LBI57_05545 [Helicobacteraceae bacterium]|jgi:hypothetical protein|nr:hypothetical protein [Helicobacteraceae bacterium]